jgi:hypothetical protein
MIDSRIFAVWRKRRCQERKLTQDELAERANANDHHAEAVRLIRSIDDRFSEGGPFTYHGLSLTLLDDLTGATSAARL